MELYDILGVLIILVAVITYKNRDKYMVIVFVVFAGFILVMTNEFGLAGKKISSVIVLATVAIIYLLRQRANNNNKSSIKTRPDEDE